jgi:asparagine synthase (glutamine-hydrolysing)
MGMAQHLLLGFPLGERTLLEGVKRVAPGTYLRIDPRGGEIHEASAPAAVFGRRDDRARSASEEAHTLAGLFGDACRARSAPHGGNVVSLSGGADSRCVAACLHRDRIPFRCVTFLDSEGTSAADVEVAARLATLLEAPWHSVRLRAPSRAGQLHLLRLKSGLNPLSMAHLIPYLEEVQRIFGAGISFLTGDGGDKLLPDLRADASVVDAERTATELLQAHQVFSPREVEAITGVVGAEVLAELRRRLDSYPEERWPDRRVHFEILERAYKWLFEGEDRNRSYFWSTTPFYSTPFFLAAAGCAGEHKAHRVLQRDFLLEISPAAASVEYAGVGAAMTSPAFRVAAKAASLLARLPGRRWQGIPPRPRRTSAATPAADCLRQQLELGGPIEETLRRDGIVRFLGESAADRPDAAESLLTLTSLIEHLAAPGRRP